VAVAYPSDQFLRGDRGIGEPTFALCCVTASQSIATFTSQFA